MIWFSTMRKWQNVARFSVLRLSDYASLAAVEFDLAKRRFLRDLILYAVLGLSAMFGLAFVCIAAIVSAAKTPYLIETAWTVAGFWIFAAVGTFIVVRTREELGTFSVIGDELQRDIQAIKERL
ncbi:MULTISPECIES: phage holin family protein [Burkholderia]|uniref:phage holin family protein n=1 Tax=Burkholderia TaxID=32008 RepID=UPI0014544F55|nr:MULTISPECIES: phage holin family protein [Burkholderia]MBN3744391.1 hypothetical protein [Burkholderia sp. Se-20373]MBN3771944.1 hypothetical protein [Burkholderia sp. Se-20378]MBN3793674.1 hypothetical protein [Burkholderia sp. Ac-20392]VWC48815.1 hypothetical protein BLA6860_07634 [Burkholderia lata]